MVQTKSFNTNMDIIKRRSSSSIGTLDNSRTLNPANRRTQVEVSSLSGVYLKAIEISSWADLVDPIQHLVFFGLRI